MGPNVPQLRNSVKRGVKRIFGRLRRAWKTLRWVCSLEGGKEIFQGGFFSPHAHEGLHGI